MKPTSSVVDVPYHKKLQHFILVGIPIAISIWALQAFIPAVRQSLTFVTLSWISIEAVTVAAYIYLALIMPLQSDRMHEKMDGLHWGTDIHPHEGFVGLVLTSTGTFFIFFKDIIVNPKIHLINEVCGEKIGLGMIVIGAFLMGRDWKDVAKGEFFTKLKSINNNLPFFCRKVRELFLLAFGLVMLSLFSSYLIQEKINPLIPPLACTTGIIILIFGYATLHANFHSSDFKQPIRTIVPLDSSFKMNAQQKSWLYFVIMGATVIIITDFDFIFDLLFGIQIFVARTSLIEVISTVIFTFVCLKWGITHGL